MERESLAGVSVAEPSRPSGPATIAWLVAALFAHVLLLDAAVETFWGGSPLRWWVSPSLLAYGAFSLWLWRPGGGLLRRFGPAAAAVTPLLGLMAALAVTAWLPAGQTNGVRVLLQPTPALLAATLAAGVVLAALALLRGAVLLRGAPRLVLRALVVVLGLYALAALAVALRDDTSFALLFQGGAMWRRLPRWLQGTSAGALVLLPLSILVEAARLAARLRRRESVRAVGHQAVALVLALVMAASGIVLPPARGAAGAIVPSGAPVASAVDDAAASVPTEQIRRQLIGREDWPTAARRYLDLVERELRRPAADPSDIEAKAAELGNDSHRIFEFVRDTVVLEPYVGQLRGARGTLAARAGNALDRALLAQALLGAAKVESRLVKGRLSMQHAESLFRGYLARGPLEGPLATCALRPDAASVATTAREMAAMTGLGEEGVLASLRRAWAQADIMWRNANEQRDAQLAFLNDQLRRSGVGRRTEWQALQQQLPQRLQEHYWLQVRNPDATWAEFDTAFPDARPGQGLGSGGAVLSAIPAGAVHRFDFSLVYRTRSGESLREEVLLRREMPAADALFAPADFRIQPARGGVDASRLLSMDRNAALKAVRALARFQPVLRSGKQVVFGRVFDLKGRTYDEAASRGPSGLPGGMMGGLLGFGGGQEAAPEFHDLRVVLRLSGPGREPLVQVRTLTSAADVNAATFAPPLTEWEFLVQAQWIPPEFVSFQALKLLLEGARAAATSNGASIPAPSPVPMRLLELAIARQTAAAQNLARDGRIKPLIERPLLTISTHGLAALRFDEGRIVTRRTIDIVENSIRYVPREEKSQGGAFDAALHQGVADCVLEQAVLEEASNGNPETPSALFHRALREGRPVQLATPSDAAGLHAAGMSPTDVDWIRSYERNDARLVVAQPSGGRAAWWTVQPDGNAVLRVSGGEGQAMSEHAIETLHDVMTLICGFEIMSLGSDEGGHGGGGGHGAEAGDAGGGLLQWEAVHKAEFVAKRVGIAVCALSGLAAIASAWVVTLHGFALVLLGLDIGVFIAEKGFELGMSGVKQLENHYRSQAGHSPGGGAR